MAMCPRCQSDFDADFGMVKCPSCNTLLFVDMDGNAQFEGIEQDSEIAPPPISPETGVSEALEYTANEADQSEPYEEVSEQLPVQEVAESRIEDVFPDPPTESGPEDHSSTVIDYDSEPEDKMEIVTPEPPRDPADLSEIAEFGNSEVSQGREGLLSYSLTISGIDSKEIRQYIAEALTDSRFVWQSKEVLSSISKGKLTIIDINAVKTSIIVNRLKHLPVEITWEQHEITQPA